MLDRDCIARALLRSPHLSSGESSRLVFEHLRDLLDPTDPASGFEALSRLVGTSARGGVPQSDAHILDASRLVALATPARGVRPIAIG